MTPVDFLAKRNLPLLALTTNTAMTSRMRKSRATTIPIMEEAESVDDKVGSAVVDEEVGIVVDEGIDDTVFVLGSLEYYKIQTTINKELYVDKPLEHARIPWKQTEEKSSKIGIRQSDVPVEGNSTSV